MTGRPLNLPRSKDVVSLSLRSWKVMGKQFLVSSPGRSAMEAPEDCEEEAGLWTPQLNERTGTFGGSTLLNGVQGTFGVRLIF